MQPSYCFHGATATHRSSNSITSHSRCSHERRVGVAGASLVVLSRHYCRVFPTSIQRPVYLHAGICLSCLILAHYSCRSRSPVSSKARDATPDLTLHPFIVHRLSPEVFRIARLLRPPSLGYRVPPHLAIIHREGSDGRCLLLHLRLSLFGWSMVQHATCLVSQVAHRAGWAWRSEA